MNEPSRKSGPPTRLRIGAVHFYTSRKIKMLTNLLYSPSILFEERSRTFRALKFPSCCGRCPVDEQVMARHIVGIPNKKKTVFL